MLKNKKKDEQRIILLAYIPHCSAQAYPHKESDIVYIS